MFAKPLFRDRAVAGRAHSALGELVLAITRFVAHAIARVNTRAVQTHAVVGDRHAGEEPRALDFPDALNYRFPYLSLPEGDR
jgi:hypothetical protein